jgi:hypothetical protein
LTLACLIGHAPFRVKAVAHFFQFFLLFSREALEAQLSCGLVLFQKLGMELSFLRSASEGLQD